MYAVIEIREWEDRLYTWFPSNEKIDVIQETFDSIRKANKNRRFLLVKVVGGLND